MLKVGQAASRIDASPTWIRDNTKAFADFLSDSARPAKGGTRLYNDDDIAVLATIKRLKNEGQPTEAITAHLAAGGPLDYPPDAPESPQDAQSSSALMTEREIRLSTSYSDIQGELRAVTNERDRLAGQLADSQAAHLAAETARAAAEAKLELYQSDLAIQVVHSQQAQQPPAEEQNEATGRAWWKVWQR